WRRLGRNHSAAGLSPIQSRLFRFKGRNSPPRTALQSLSYPARRSCLARGPGTGRAAVSCVASFLISSHRAKTMSNAIQDKPLTIAGRTFQSRLLVGTGNYKDLTETQQAIEASGAEIVTVAVRRTNLGQNPDEPNLLDVLPPDRYAIPPNTAGCYTAKDAVRTCKLARELLDGHD